MKVEEKYLKEESGYIEAVDTYVNGNISDFKDWLNDRNTTKKDILQAVKYYSSFKGEIGIGRTIDVFTRYLNK